MITFLAIKSFTEDFYIESLGQLFLIFPILLIFDLLFIIFQPIFIILYLKFKDDLS